MTKRPLAAAALVVALAACGETVQEQYQLVIVGPVDTDYLAGVTEVLLQIGASGQEARTTISPGRSFTLAATEVDVTQNRSGALRISGRDAAGNLLVYGQTPEMELALFTPAAALRVFIQKSGTFGRSRDLPNPRKGHLGLTTTATPSTSTALMPMHAPLFGTGRVVPLDPNTGMPRPSDELSTDDLNVYNPLTHLVNVVGNTPTVATPAEPNVRQPRTDAAWLPRGDTVIVFGGLLPAGTEMKAMGHLDVLRLTRRAFVEFGLNVATTKTTDKPGVARSRSVLAFADGVYAFGGRGAAGALDTVVGLDTTTTGDAFTVLDARMQSPREGHTATGVSGMSGPEVLVFGGGMPGTAVAEIFVPGTTMPGQTPIPAAFTAPMTGSPGPGRRDHAAVPLPDTRVLILGGTAGDGTPLADSVMYAPKTRTFEPGPITLRTARSAFTAFVIGTELVIVGGRGPDGHVVSDAEVFSVEGLQPKPVVPAYGRARATPSVLPNLSAIVIGGEEENGAPSPVVEVYQPGR